MATKLSHRGTTSEKTVTDCPACLRHRRRIDELVKASASLDGDESASREWMRQFDRETAEFMRHREEKHAN